MKTLLKSNEHIELEVKQHFIVLIVPAIISIIILITGIALFKKVSTVSFFLIIISIVYFIYKIMQRKNNLWAVTNLRIIDEKGVFTLNSKESPLDKINNISYSESILGRILGYGNVQIQTAGEAGITTYRNVEKPRLLKDTMFRMQEEYKSYFFHQKDNISTSDEIEKLYNLMQKGIITKVEFEERKTKILSN